MIEGRVTSREATIQLAVRALDGEADHTIEAVVDTGFDRSLTLPPRLIEALDLKPRGQTTVILADGSSRQARLYAVVVEWNREMRPIIAEEAETTPLVGMALLDGFELRMQCRDGGRVEIEEM